MSHYFDLTYVKISKQMLKIIFDTLTAKKFIIAFDIQGRNQKLYHGKAHQKWKIKTSDLVTLQIAKNKSADQTVHMRRLICVFVVHKQYR